MIPSSFPYLHSIASSLEGLWNRGNTAPVLVGSGGVFSLDGGGGGTLAINGSEFGTSNFSLYTSGNVNLSNGINLNTSSGIKGAVSSRVATLDNQTATIAVASGNPCVMDGAVLIDDNENDYSNSIFGQLVFSCDTLDFDGELDVHVSGNSSNEGDQLIVNGALALGTNSSLNVEETNPSAPASWIIITSTGGDIGNFGYSDDGQLGMVDEPNLPSAGDYTVQVPSTSSSGCSSSSAARRGIASPSFGLYTGSGALTLMSSALPNNQPIANVGNTASPTPALARSQADSLGAQIDPLFITLARKMLIPLASAVEEDGILQCVSFGPR